CQHHNSYPYIF
nr:immunoglobulin light chain junction region [Macaca mulatta]